MLLRMSTAYLGGMLRGSTSAVNRIREYREARGLTQPELDMILRVAPGTTSRWERGIVTPTPKNQAKLARRLGVDVEQLGLG
jgi:transcriptional regulator with XRE-family HTH domain